MTRAAIMEAEPLPADHLPGANNPPPEPTPFDAHVANIGDLFTEAKHWLDGDAITNQAQADAVQTLLRMIQEAERAADASRVEENKPYDEAKAAVQAKYAPLIANTKAVKGETVLAAEACKAALTVWLRKVAAEQAAEAERLRKIAVAEVQAAADALRAARETTDLDALEQAEGQIQDAAAAARAATRAEAAKPIATGYGRSVGLRENWVIKGFAPVESPDGPAIDGETALLRYYWTANKPALVQAALDLARLDIRGGKRTLPGLIIANEPAA